MVSKNSCESKQHNWKNHETLKVLEKAMILTN